MKTRPAWTAVVFVGLWAALFWFGRSGLFRDPGTFWHTVAGGRILDSGAVPRTDTFSFTLAGQPWVDQSWFAEVLMAAIYRGGGWDGLLACTVTLLAAVYTAIAARLLRSGLHPAVALFLLFLAVAAGSPQFHVRPLIVTTAFFYATFALLVDVEAGRRPARKLWWLVPLCVVWTNCHGGVLGGLGTIGLVVPGWLFVAFRSKAAPSRPSAADGNATFAERKATMFNGIAVAAACGLAVLVNPYGVDLPRGWLRILDLPLTELIVEHSPLSFREPIGWVVAVMAAGYVVTLVAALPRRPCVTWLLPLVWFVLAWQRSRNAQLFAISAAIAWVDLLPHSRVAAWLARRDLFSGPDEHRTTRPPHRFRPAALALAGSLVAVLPLWGIWPSGAESRWARFDPSRWPLELLPELEKIQCDQPPSAPIFNDMPFGGFLIYHTPRLRVFIDDRCELYGGDFLLDYDRAQRHDPAKIDAWAAQYGFRYALVEAGGSFDRYLERNPQWSLVRRSGPAALYCRPTTRQRPFPGQGRVRRSGDHLLPVALSEPHLG